MWCYRIRQSRRRRGGRKTKTIVGGPSLVDCLRSSRCTYRHRLLNLDASFGKIRTRKGVLAVLVVTEFVICDDDDDNDNEKEVTAVIFIVVLILCYFTPKAFLHFLHYSRCFLGYTPDAFFYSGCHFFYSGCLFSYSGCHFSTPDASSKSIRTRGNFMYARVLCLRA
jgi:hypothetical protein